MSDYNYDKFETAAYQLNAFQAPELGTKAPDFMLETLRGDKQNLLDFEGDFLVLELGSVTCPLFQSRRDTMQDLAQTNPDTSFAVLYVREAHPGANCGTHKTIDDKRGNAAALDLDGETRLILIDDLAGTAHAAYGSFPNSCFIINKNGCVLYYSDWNNPYTTGHALLALKAGKPAPRQGMFLPASPPVAFKTFKIAGKGSAPDFFRGLPKLIWANLIRRNLRVLFNRPPRIMPDATC